ncbi:hypothetical protein KUF71_008337 [Frankliniella fusca]|uniref:RNA-directed DNA polymerase n=1 Tax=Frankliniella fusca TaxID=407009 RepID=A0AAE1LGU7_9NEOP|nr:hypothetical protein KUF71_008337 [Frankliniella fusca]
MDESRPGPVKLREGNISANRAAFEQRFDISWKANPSRQGADVNEWAVLMREAGRAALEVYNSFKDSLTTAAIDANGSVVKTDPSKNYEAVIAEFRKYAEEKKSVTSIREASLNGIKSLEPMTNDLKKTLRGQPQLTLAQVESKSRSAETRRKVEAGNSGTVDSVETKLNKERPLSQVSRRGSSGTHQSSFRGHRGAFRGRYVQPRRGQYHRQPQRWILGYGDTGHFEKVCGRGRAKKPRVESATKIVEVVRAVEPPPKPLESVVVPEVKELLVPNPIVETPTRSAERSAYLLDSYSTEEEVEMNLLTDHMEVNMVDTISEDGELRKLREYTEAIRLQGSLRLEAFNQTMSPVKGSFMALAETKHGAASDLEFVVTKSIKRPLLGIEACYDLNLVKRGLGQFKQTVDVEVNSRGWPLNKSSVSEAVWPYWKLRHDLFVEDGLVIYEEKVVEPLSLRPKVLKSLHAAHLGMEKTKAREREVVFWPGITNDIQTLVADCRVCERHSPANQREPLIPHAIPELRFQKVRADIMEFRPQPYLVVVDNYSKWPEIKILKSKSSGSVISVLREVFSTHGIPEIVFGDSNPLNSYECRQYAESIGSSIVTSCPEYPRSLAEKGVHIAKQLLKKCFDSDTHYLDALWEYNNTPLSEMSFSPAQILMSRMVRTSVPARSKALEPKVVDLGGIPQAMQQKVKNQHDRRARRKSVKFDVGQPILYWRNRKWYKGTVVEKLQAPRSYLIRQLNDRVLRRNTWHFQKSTSKPDRFDEPPVEEYQFTVPRSVLQTPQPQLVARQEPLIPRWGFQDLEDHLEMEDGRAVDQRRQRPPHRRRQQVNLNAGWRRLPASVEGPVRAFTRRGRPVRLPARYRDF